MNPSAAHRELCATARPAILGIGFEGNPLSLQFDAAQALGQLETRLAELRQALLTAQHS